MARPGTVPMIGGAVVALVGVLPFCVTMLAAWIASSHGCRLDEGDAHPCVVLGADRGETLYAMAMAFWLELLTVWLIPVGLVFFGVGLYLRLRRPLGG